MDKRPSLGHLVSRQQQYLWLPSVSSSGVLTFSFWLEGIKKKLTEIECNPFGTNVFKFAPLENSLTGWVFHIDTYFWKFCKSFWNNNLISVNDSNVLLALNSYLRFTMLVKSKTSVVTKIINDKWHRFL